MKKTSGYKIAFLKERFAENKFNEEIISQNARQILPNPKISMS